MFIIILFSILGLISYKPMMFPKASWMLAFGKLSKYMIAKNTFQAPIHRYTYISHISISALFYCCSPFNSLSTFMDGTILL